MSSILGIIGGSGVYNIDGIKIIKEHYVETPFGETTSNVVEAQVNGATFFFLARHGKGHFFNPSEVNYRANIFALKKLGVQYIVSVSAVGSLKEEYAPGTFVLVDQFIDWTKGLRKRSFFENGMAGHVSCANPIEKSLQELVGKICKEVDVKYAMNGSYICIEGPQFSTKAESNIYRSFGASVIGMTNVPEAFLAKEAGIAYATIAMVTDYDCWKDEHCTVEEVVRVMKTNNAQVQKVILKLVPSLLKNPPPFKKENEFAIMTDPTLINVKNKTIVEMLTK